jgi:hypothetical protein
MNRILSGVYALWLFGLLLHFVACWAVVRKGYFTRWKAFSYYLFVMTAEAALMLPVSFWGTEELYQHAYTVASILEWILLSLVVLEVMVKLLEPFEALPGKTVARFGFLAVIGVSLAVALSVFFPAHESRLSVSISLTVERTVFLAYAALLWAMIIQAKSLGISWISSVAEIAIAFVLYLTVQATERFVIGAYYANRSVINIATGVGQFAYLVALGSWIWTMTHRGPVTAAPPAEVIARLAENPKHELVPRERIFAAVGVRVNKAEPDTENDPVVPPVIH